jgi:hypothetical protein
MRCGLLKLSRILHEARSEPRPPCGTDAPALLRSKARAGRRPAGERRSKRIEGDREAVSWTVPVDNFS